ncbi:MAG: class I SAM-dependent methyltransferase [Erythrobacter sp.]
MNDFKRLVQLAEAGQSAERCQELQKRTLLRIARELAPFNVGPHKSSAKPSVTPRRVNLGAGRDSVEGYFSVDLAGEPDLLWDLRESVPFASDSVEELLCEHFLEHIDRDYSAPHFLKECFRALSPGGRLTIGVPDGQAVIEAYQGTDSSIDEFRASYNKRNLSEPKLDEPFNVLGMVFYDSYADSRYTPHYWTYSEGSLGSLLAEAGFSDVQRIKTLREPIKAKRFARSVYLEAWKAE